MKKAMRYFATLCVAVSCLLASGVAAPQAPPHRPGTVCFTPYFYCTLDRPQSPGSTCFCPRSDGKVQGVAD
jgi:hypothetical protein